MPMRMPIPMRTGSRTISTFLLLFIPVLAVGCLSVPHQTRNSPPPVPQQQSGFTEAERVQAAGDLQEAKRLYTRIHQGNPENAECSHRLARVYSQLNRHADADVFYRKAHQYDQNNPELLADLGDCAFQRQDYQQAEQWFEQTLQRRSQNPKGVEMLAASRAWLKKDSSSFDTYRRLYPEAEALQKLAAIQIARGDQGAGLSNNQLAETMTPQRSEFAENSLPPAPQVFPIPTETLPQISSIPTRLAANQKQISTCLRPAISLTSHREQRTATQDKPQPENHVSAVETIEEADETTEELDLTLDLTLDDENSVPETIDTEELLPPPPPPNSDDLIFELPIIDGQIIHGQTSLRSDRTSQPRANPVIGQENRWRPSQNRHLTTDRNDKEFH